MILLPAPIPIAIGGLAYLSIANKVSSLIEKVKRSFWAPVVDYRFFTIVFLKKDEKNMQPYLVSDLGRLISSKEISFPASVADFSGGSKVEFKFPLWVTESIKEQFEKGENAVLLAMERFVVDVDQNCFYSSYALQVQPCSGFSLTDKEIRKLYPKGSKKSLCIRNNRIYRNFISSVSDTDIID